MNACNFNTKQQIYVGSILVVSALAYSYLKKEKAKTKIPEDGHQALKPSCPVPETAPEQMAPQNDNPFDPTFLRVGKQADTVRRQCEKKKDE